VTKRILGVGFIGLVCLMMWLTYAFYAKVFTETVPITLETSHIGLQLNQHADVKLRGIIVGEVQGVSTDGELAKVRLAIKPDQLRLIPADVSARILPKTLFGEKYVSLVPPPGDGGRSLHTGDVIERDRTAVGIEIEKVLNDALPLLQAVDPADLNATLNTLATALEGRGDDLAKTLTQLDGYLKKLNPHLPELVASLKKLTQVAALYSDATPDIVRFLRNSTLTGNTVVEKEVQLQKFFGDVTTLANTTNGFLGENEDRVIRLGQVTEPILAVLAKQAPAAPCFLKVMAETAPILNDTFRDNRLNINVELITNQPTPYTPDELPAYLDKRAPTCVSKNYEVPEKKGPYTQDNPAPYLTGEDGVKGDHNKNTTNPLPLGRAGTALGGPGVDTSYVGTPEEQRLVSSILGPAMGIPADQVPDLATMMFGPLARGAQVSVS